MFKIKQLYSFEVYPSALLGQDFKGLQLSAIISFDMARVYEDVTAIHKTAYANLPPGTNANPEYLTYLLFKTVTGDQRIIAQEWIDLSSVIESSDRVITATIPNSSIEDVHRLRSALSQEGFRDFNIEIN